jgi:polar amino acid transport system substrate-binding protein
MSKTVRILLGALATIAVIAIVALVVVLLINRGGDQTPADPLAGTKWQAQSYANPAEAGGLASPLGGTQLTAEFAQDASTKESIVNGTSGCNNYTAGYTVDGDSVSIGDAASTMMFCDQPAGTMDQEAAFLTALQSASSFTVGTGHLQFLDAQGQVAIDFVPYTGMPEATEPPTAAATEPPATDDSWDRIQAAGKIVVGTSVDYPPFESYVGPGQVDGFDIALMDEIGRRLGVQIEYHDIAFDGLGPSLIQGQIDAAIAAISRTPEREAEVDFTNVYLVAEDGVLARADSNITIGSADDLAKYKVGVQRNTVYQEWFQTTLIDPGRMSPDNLFAYEKAEDAIRDLKEQRIDLVTMDAQAAQAFADQGGVKLVAKGRGQQNYAIALPKGAAALKAKLDETITGMYNDGTIANLAQRYLQIAQVLPTPTPAPTSTAAPQPPCTDGLALVKQLTQEGDMKPGQAFTKGWQVKNTGTCTWDSSYQVVFVDGYRMGGEPAAVAGNVSPGQTYDVQINLVAPLKPGSYQGAWQMQNGQGQGFGERLKVDINVLAAPTVTPAPTQTPVAGISFTVDRTNIKQGECVTFKWKVDNVKEVYFYKEGQRWQDNGVTGEGSRLECPPSTIPYYLRVVLRDNTVDTRQIIIYVEPVADAPAISRFTADPAGQITLGQCVTLRWKVEGQIQTVGVTANDGVLWSPAPAVGNTSHCPNRAGTVTYSVEAVGPGGTSRQTQTLNVVEAATATPVPTPEPEAPVINSFSVTPNQIQAGECVGLYWSVGGGTTASRIRRNGEVLIDDAGYSGQQMDCVDAAGSYTYVLEALGASGQQVTQQQAVSVTETAPENPLAGTRWQVTSLSDPATGSSGAVLPGSTLTMAFDRNGKANGSSGCNTFSTSYLLYGQELVMTPPTGTSMLCSTPEGIMEQEATFLTLLSAVSSYTIEGKSLYLNNATDQVLVELVAY